MIRRATDRDVDAITGLIHELAEYEKLREQCTVRPDQIRSALFGADPSVFAHVADVDGQVVGFAMWFLSFSTWDGVNGIYLEDLYVQPELRGSGIGSALLAALAAECVTHGYTRLGWSVLDWNTPSIGFYESLGAVAQSEWTAFRLGGEPLRALAARASARS